MNNPQQQKRNSIADLSSETLMLILQLRSTNEYGNAATLKSRVADLFDKFEREGRTAGIDNEKVRLAKFALVAFLDETIISSSWTQKDEWLAEPMQIKLFDTFNAGEEFFEHLHQLRQRSSGNADILEVYYLCLALGFKGKYQLQSPENLRRVIDDLNLELHPEMYSAIDSISPNAKPKDTFIQTTTGGIPLWIYPAGALLVFVLLYIILSVSISGTASDVSELLNSLIS
ncbi:MAG: type IVB secretion system protein IcmH/DotU [Ignavibacteriaceae bacterium]